MKEHMPDEHTEDYYQSIGWSSLSCTVGAAAFLSYMLLVWLRRDEKNKGKKLPPGPGRGIPLFGHLEFMKANFHSDECMEWAKTYGPVFRIKAGVASIVVLNDFESIKKYITKKEVLYRPENWIFKGRVISGVGTLNGQEWVDNRRFCLHVLRDLGFGKKSMEEFIKEEAEFLIDKLAGEKQRAIPIQDYLFPSMSNNITALVFGSRFPYDDPRRLYLDDRLRSFFKAVRAGSMVNPLPEWVKHVFRIIPFLRRGVIVKHLQQFVEFTSNQVKEHEKTLDEHFNRDFIDGYLKKMNEHQGNPTTNFKKTTLVGNVLSFFLAGSNTVAATIHWHMLNCAQNQEAQKQIQREIDEVVGRERRPTWEDRNKMPYTMAAIWEMYRWKTISPMGVPRGAGEDVYFGEFFIPKGTVVLPNVWAVHNDPAYWKNPEKFDPTRFLKEDNPDLITRPERVIPFSIGKRMCAGETLATVEVFLYLTTLLQKFHVLPEEGRSFNLDPRDITLADLAPEKLRFLPR